MRIYCIALEKAMAPHSSTLAWKIPWMEDPGRLQSMGWRRVRHDWAISLSLLCTGEGNGNPLQCCCLENPGMGSHRVGHDWSDLAAAATLHSTKQTNKQNGNMASLPITMTRSAADTAACSLLHSVIQWVIGPQSVSSVAQSCPTLCDPMDCSTPGFPVHHQLPELAQTHVHWVGDAIQPSRPLPSPSPAFDLSQHQGLIF